MEVIFYEISLKPASGIIGISKNATFVDLGDGSYIVEFSSSQSARYSLFVTLDGLHVAASPYEVYISPFFMNTTLSRLQAIRSIRNGTSGSKFGAELIAVDMFGNIIGPDDIGASLDGSFGSSVDFHSSKVDYSTTLEASGRLTFSFFGTLSGTYTVSVFLN